VVTICTASLTFNNSRFCPHSVFMCFVWIWEQTAIISLYNIKWLVYITETDCVYCVVLACVRFFMRPSVCVSADRHTHTHTHTVSPTDTTSQKDSKQQQNQVTTKVVLRNAPPPNRSPKPDINPPTGQCLFTNRQFSCLRWLFWQK